MKKLNISGSSRTDAVLIIGGVVVLYFLIKGFQALLEKTNIIPDKEEREAKKTIAGQTGEEKKPATVTAQGFTPVIQAGGAFNENYYKTLIKNAGSLAKEKGLKSGVILLQSAGLNSDAQKIWDSVRTPLAVPNPLYWIDNPQQGLGVFRKYRYKSQVSQLAEAFNKKYKKDLYFWLADKYDTQDQKQALADIVEIVKNLPSGGFIFPKNRSINEITVK